MDLSNKSQTIKGIKPPHMVVKNNIIIIYLQPPKGLEQNFLKML